MHHSPAPKYQRHHKQCSHCGEWACSWQLERASPTANQATHCHNKCKTDTVRVQVIMHRGPMYSPNALVTFIDRCIAAVQRVGWWGCWRLLLEVCSGGWEANSGDHTAKSTSCRKKTTTPGSRMYWKRGEGGVGGGGPSPPSPTVVHFRHLLLIPGGFADASGCLQAIPGGVWLIDGDAGRKRTTYVNNRVHNEHNECLSSSRRFCRYAQFPPRIVHNSTVRLFHGWNSGPSWNQNYHWT